MSASCFHLTAQDGRSVPHTAPIPGGHRSSLPMWVGPPYHCPRRHQGSRRPLHFSPPTIRLRTLLLRSVPAAASPAITHRRRVAPSCPTEPKEAPCHRAPPAPRVCPQRRLAKSGHGISPLSSSSVSTTPAAAFSDCSPHLADPVASFAPPRSSSPTTSPTTSTTPSAPH
jgi:hypothetical protein